MTSGFAPRFLSLESALGEFVGAASTQAQEHIRPLHKYIAMRLVFEGGFRPEEITPRPPLRLVQRPRGAWEVVFDEDAENDSEQTVLGGLKTKQVDVVVSKPSVGPVIAVSVKGTVGAFRNLTNRMEEAIGDSTNIHIMYPGLVYGFLHCLRANRAGEEGLRPNDFALDANDRPVRAIQRYHDVLLGLAGRRLVRNDYTRYEAVALALVESGVSGSGQLLPGFPSDDSPLLLNRFFGNLYSTYDLRYPYMAETITSLRRLEWRETSPALQSIAATGLSLGYSVRLA